MSEHAPLTEREIKLVEEIGFLRRQQEIAEIIYCCLVVRLGGSALIRQDEIDFARKNYELHKDIHIDDLTLDIKLQTRLR